LVCTGNAVGSYTVIVTGTYQTLSHSIVITVNVQDFTVSLSPSTIITPVNVRATATASVTAINGFTGTVSLTASSSPAGPSCNLSPAAVVLPPSPSSTTLACTGFTVGNYTVAVTGTSGSLSHTTNLNLRISDFAITTNPASVTAVSGSTGASTVNLASQNGFSSTVSLSISTTPTGLACSLTQPTITLTTTGSSTLNCNDSVGTYTVTITATGSSVTHSATVTYTIQDFAISGSTSITVNSGIQGSASLSLAPVNGFKGNITLTATPNAVGLTCSLNPSIVMINAAATSLLSCTGTAGIFQVTVTALNGTLSHSIIVSYTVQDMLLVPATNGISITDTTPGSTTIIIVSQDGYTGTVALSILTNPANGISCSLTPSSITLGTFGTSTLSCNGSAGTYIVTITASGAGGLSRATTVTYTIHGQSTQPLNLFYFIITAAIAGTGLVGAAMFKRFNTTDAPFDTFYKMAGGELRPPLTLLIVGDAGSGTTTLGLQILQSQLDRGYHCGLLTYDAFPSEVETKMRSIGVDLTKSLQDGHLEILDCYSALAGNEKAGIVDPLDFTEISIQVTGIIDRAKNGPVSILLDSITPLFNTGQSGAAINFLRVIGAKVKNSNGVFILTGTNGSIPDEVRSKVEAHVDSVIDIGTMRKGDKVTRTLLFKKNAGHQTSAVPTEFEITPTRGIVFKKRRLTFHHHAKPAEAPVSPSQKS
jgi:KaiC/GvpD/RAD55 family RecA-like ATPase